MSSLFEEMWDEIAEKNKKLADLEAKLAERENQIRGFQEAIKKRDKKIEGLNKGLSKTQSKSYKIKQSKSQDIITIASQTEKERNLQKQLEDTIEQGICYQAEIHQLKQQLAEKETEIKQLKSQSAVDEDWLCSQRARLTELEDEVALLEKSNISLTNDLSKLQKYVTTLQKQLEESKHKNICLIMEQNQTAIAELEKVKKLLDDCYGYEYTSLYHFIQSKAEEKIDQLIKELKGEK